MSRPMPSGTLYNRRPSRSNSTSSSTVTVKKTPSLSSRSASRDPLSKFRSPSPEQVAFQVAAIVTSNRGRPNSRSSQRSSVVDSKAQNINRWSHSTSSSISGLEEASRKRKGSSSRRLSVGPIHASTFLNNSTKTSTLPTLDNNLRPRRLSQVVAAPIQALQGSILKPPPVATLPKIVNPRSASRTPSTPTTNLGTAELPTSSSYGIRARDYFGNDWHGRGPILPGIDSGTAEPTSNYPSSTSPPRRSPASQQVRSTDSFRDYGRLRGQEPQNRSREMGYSREPPQSDHDRSANGSIDSAARSSQSSIRSDRTRNKGHRSPTQKTMLSKALAKANTAVLLDNAQNFEGAVDAYVEACELLGEVMLRSSDDEDKTKLSAIRSTYSSRIAELKDVEDPGALSSTDKALPRRPGSIDHSIAVVESYYDDEALSINVEPPDERHEPAFPPRRQSLMPSVFINLSQSSFDIAQNDIEERKDVHDGHEEPTKLLVQPPRSRYAPPPLSPRRPPSPPAEAHGQAEPQMHTSVDPLPSSGHVRDLSTGSTSWLDTIDESASSASSTRLSSLYLRPSFESDMIDEIEADFDAALSAAVEAAYHEISVPGITDPEIRQDQNSTPVTVHRDSPSEATPVIPPQDESLSLSRTIEPHVPTPGSFIQSNTNQDLQLYDDEAEEEERLLEEMTQGYGFGDFHFDKQSKSALPRQSDSSGFSGRTWPSSNGSTTATNATSLSTLAEIMEAPSIDQKTLPPRPPPVGALPPPPGLASEPLPRPSVTTHIAEAMDAPIDRSMSASTEPGRPSFDKPIGPGVRERRLSGHNAKQLKIETHQRSGRSSITQPAGNLNTEFLPIIQAPPATEPSPITVSEHDLNSLVGPPSQSTLAVQPLTPIASIHSASSIQSESPATPALTHGESQLSVDESIPVPSSPGRSVDVGKARLPQSTIRKNMSQASLRIRNLSAATTENTESPVTPGSATFPTELRKLSGHALTLSGPPTGSMSLFDDRIGAAIPRRMPGTLNMDSDIPAPLEPCPNSFLLRPFWLMRCLYQVIAHPRGGYLTTSLFVPHDIWRVKNVKLKAVEDKVAQSDLLSAALLRLANVDQLDADAVLEEMQAFEIVLESVRTVLQKKLGSDVGLAGSNGMFKGIPTSSEEASNGHHSKAGSAAKLASSWRKLRSKSSAVQLNSYAAVPQKDSKTQDAGFTLPTLPMTSSNGMQSSRTHQARRNPTALDFSSSGANANYLASLARLFDAVQILDSIARQVEDPGLKCSSKTHVGLELCVRNASEFFAFFVVRWVVADIGSLVDKFVKRGGEWIMS